jgi:hypothetical protein
MSKKVEQILILLVICSTMLVMPVLAVTSGMIVGWGDNSYGTVTPPAGNDYVAIEASRTNSIALKSDGSIVGWGDNDWGLVSAIPAGNNYVAISAGGYHCLALKSDGSIVGWGSNGFGEATSPGGNDYKAIAAGGYMNSCALKNDGSIVCWGATELTSSPSGNDYVAIAAGLDHGLALKSDGSIVGWGGNTYGQASPPGGNDYVAISAGLFHSLALKSDGSIVDWGNGYAGQATPPAGNDYKAISAGWYHNFALKSDGSIVGWGFGNPAEASPPVGNDYVAIDAGLGYGLALKALVTNQPPAIIALSGPLDPLPVDIPIQDSLITGTFTDPQTSDTHTGIWDWGDGTTSPGYIIESNGAGTISGSHTYTNPGIYTLGLTISDNQGASDMASYQYIVIYDPNGGYVTGGGWIMSPAGAYVIDPTLSGKATFGFVSKYLKGAKTPSGATEFQFKTGNLNFHSDSYEWLVVAGSKAMYKGVGTVNGAGNYGFLLSAIDGSQDKFRIKIWDVNKGNGMVYDNQITAPDDANPTTIISGGNIVIHK